LLRGHAFICRQQGHIEAPATAFLYTLEIAGTLGGFQNADYSSLSEPGNRSAKQTKEFEYWRTAAELVERMREAGFDCDLWIDPKNRH
jgi:hypothetical protein